MSHTLAAMHYAVLILLTSLGVAAESDPDVDAALPGTARRLIDQASENVAKARASYLAAALKEQAKLLASLAKELDAQTRAGKLEAALAVKARIEKIQGGSLLAEAEQAGETDLLGNPLGKPIPKDAVEYNGHHYLFVTEPLTWTKAKAACEAVGGHLVVIENSKEQNAVRELTHGRSSWLGLTDEAMEGKWVWLDGSPCRYNEWNGGEPNDSAGVEDHAQMLEDGRWNDINVDARVGGYVCEWER
jgi:hypothetical protein